MPVGATRPAWNAWLPSRYVRQSRLLSLEAQLPVVDGEVHSLSAVVRASSQLDGAQDFSCSAPSRPGVGGQPGGGGLDGKDVAAVGGIRHGHHGDCLVDHRAARCDSHHVDLEADGGAEGW